MRRPAVHCLTAAVLFTAVTGCSDQLVSPLPVSAPATAASTPTSTPATTPSASAANTPTATVAPAPPRKTAATTRTTRPKPATPAEPSACLGAVEYNVDTNDELLPGSLCLEVGGVLIVRNIGPGDDNGFSVKPESMTDGFYEAGTISTRFVRSGTATVKFPRGNGDIHTITVVVKP